MLKTRVITAVTLLAGLLVVLFFLPTPGWLGFCALICALAAWEWGGLAGWGRKARVIYGAVLWCLCFAGGVILLSPHASFPLMLFFFAWVFWLLVVPLWLSGKWPLMRSWWSAVLAGVVVLIPPALVFFALRELFGPWFLLSACALVWVADIAAYFSGRAIGGRKLAPSISPGKTWAGAIGAVIGVLVYCNVVWFAMDVDRMVLPAGADREGILSVLLPQAVFIALAAWSIIGDLFESLLKRQAGVKDSSNLLPGHGGILDRIDSLLPTLPLIAIFLVK
ncbi:MAG: phosphatidate cytidylyltransferase [Betaproteobacteria bacterium]|nr:phosphatidate cytidylyltransferase [Betaproteobacteria bacterium]